MSGSNVKWLPHLKAEMIPKKAHGNNLSMYSVALEGWRRGLKLKFFTALHEGKYEIQFSLAGKNKLHFFEVSKGDKVQESAVSICNDKAKSKKYLQEAGLPVPRGRKFKLGTEEDKIISFANEIGYPVVVKPSNGKLGKNVFTEIKSEKELIRIVRKLKEESNDDILIEEYIEGHDYRIYVLDNKVISVIKREPANVVGDGKHTIEELIHIKNEQRKKNPNLRTRPIKIDDDIISNLKKNNYSLQTVLDFEEKLYLRSKCNISSGGDPIDVTSEFPSHLKEIAVKAVDTIPGLIQSGIDMIVDSNKNGYIIEMNIRPGIGSHLFPVKGDAIDVPKAIIDYYFPETTNNNRTDLYFNFDKIHDILRRGFLKEIVVSNANETDNMIKKYFEAYGDVNTNRFHNWLLKQTLNLNLYGFAKNLENGTKCILVYGDTKNVKEFNELLAKNVPLMENVRYQNNYLDIPLKASFEIIDK